MSWYTDGAMMRIRLATFVALILIASAAFGSAYSASPKLVVILVIDQFRGDYLDRYHDEFGNVSRCNDNVLAFQLSTFGIPEPGSLDTGITSSGRGWFGIFCLTGIVFCSIALVLRRYARQYTP